MNTDIGQGSIVARFFLFADEAGDFTFNRKSGSKYFVVCTVVADSGDAGSKLLTLKRQLSWEGYPLRDYFHATEDKQKVRNEVFKLIASENISVQATIMEKSKAQPQVKASDETFYKYGWYYHMKHSTSSYVHKCSELMLTVASLGTNSKKIAFEDSVKSVVKQNLRQLTFKHAFWQSSVDPCLQIADYCTWAIQRKWEKGDSRSYDLIKDKITYEFELWRHGSKHYY